MTQNSDIEIARSANIKPIEDIAAKLGIDGEHLIKYGNTKAKLSQKALAKLQDKPEGKLILVTAMSPTAAGEGKTTTTVGIGDALCRIGKKAAICLREPSLGPCFGTKGGAAGGGYAQVVPMEDINLHFTGDFHAISTAHNLLSAMLDNHIYWNNKLDIDSRRVTWKRVIDLNDRSLRDVVTALGGVSNGFTRQSGFDITVASEVMAVLCLAESIEDLEQRLGNIIIGYNRSKEPVYAKDIKTSKAMTVLLKDAIMPNLVQTLENNPAFVHGGPFANIAHGCNSVMATKNALKMADYVVTEAGFGADLGAEKFINIKCRKAKLKPEVAVIVATIRALKMHGGIDKNNLQKSNPKAVEKGLANLDRHIKNMKMFGLPVVVAINHFVTDTEDEIQKIKLFCRNNHQIEAISCHHWAKGSAGTEEIANKIVELTQGSQTNFKTLYEDDMPLIDKIRTVAKKIYHASDINYGKKIEQQLSQMQQQGFGKYPVCMAKTQYSFSTDPLLIGAPSDHKVTVRELRIAAGAQFIVAICGDIMTMPGLPSTPAAQNIRIGTNGNIEGLF